MTSEVHSELSDDADFSLKGSHLSTNTDPSGDEIDHESEEWDKATRKRPNQNEPESAPDQ